MSTEWSNDATTSLTLPTGATNPSQRIVLDGTSDTILVYNNSGALIASVAATAGTDGLGNNYPAGISATGGVTSQSTFLLYNGTPAHGNLIASLASAPGTDSFGNMYFSVFNVGNQQAAHFGVDMNGVVYYVNASNVTTIITDPAREASFFYGTATGSLTYDQPYFNPYTFTIPPNVSTLRIQAWGAGGGGQFGSGAGGGGGEYAEEPAWAVTPGQTITINLGSGGQGGTSGSPHGTNGGNTIVQVNAVTVVTAHGGPGSISATTAGGTGSTNTIHHDGGGSHANTTGIGAGGAGGGAAAGTSNTGATGASNSGATGGAGGVGTNGGGSGGAGGSVVANVGAAGVSGSNPGGGSGAGGAGSSGSGNGGAFGGEGKVILTWSTSATNSLQLYTSATSGTDTHGNAYVKGIGVGSPGTGNITIDSNKGLISTFDLNQELTSQINTITPSYTSLNNFGSSFVQIAAPNTNSGISQTDGTSLQVAGGVLIGNVTGGPGSMPSNSDLNSAARINVDASFTGNFNTHIISVNVPPSGSGLDAVSQIELAPGDSTNATYPNGTISITGAIQSNGYGTGGSPAAAPGWQTPSYGTSWSASTTFNGLSGYTSLMYRLDAEDNVVIIGAAKTGATAPSGTPFVLPTGFRPKKGAYPITVQKNTSGALSIGHAYISASGNVDLFASAGAAAAANSEYLFWGIVPIGNLF